MAEPSLLRRFTIALQNGFSPFWVQISGNQLRVEMGLWIEIHSLNLVSVRNSALTKIKRKTIVVLSIDVDIPDGTDSIWYLIALYRSAALNTDLMTAVWRPLSGPTRLPVLLALPLALLVL